MQPIQVDELPKDRITLFDMRFTTPDERLSPSTVIARYILNIKKIPFHSLFIEMKEITALATHLGTPPTRFDREGNPVYTLPIIYDPTTNIAIADSLAISVYLDQQYPDTPRVVPSENVCKSFITDTLTPADRAAMTFTIPRMLRYVPEESVDYYRETREKWFGKKLEDFLPKGKEDEAWRKVMEGWERIDEVYTGSVKDFQQGKTRPGYIDAVVTGRLFWIQRVMGDEGQEWRDMSGWSGGRWKDLVDYFEGHLANSSLELDEAS